MPDIRCPVCGELLQTEECGRVPFHISHTELPCSGWKKRGISSTPRKGGEQSEFPKGERTPGAKKV